MKKRIVILVVIVLAGLQYVNTSQAYAVKYSQGDRFEIAAF